MKAECREWSARWLDGFLAGHPAQAEFDSHLAGCAGCREQIEAWQRSAAAVRRWGIPPAPGLREQTLVRLRLHGERLRERRRAVQLLAAACAASAVVNAATFGLIWTAAGLLREWLGWPAAAQPALFAAWAAAPLVLIGLILWLLHPYAPEGGIAWEDLHHG
ncbi:MAG: anti-sigma factor family protein [Terriglobales bacterium]